MQILTVEGLDSKSLKEWFARIFIVDTLSAMTAIVQKWGNSLAVRLPKAVAEQIEASEGVELEMKVVENALILKTAKQRYSLSELMGGVTAKNVHTEFEWGKPKGKEAW